MLGKHHGGKGIFKEYGWVGDRNGGVSWRRASVRKLGSFGKLYVRTGAITRYEIHPNNTGISWVSMGTEVKEKGFYLSPLIPLTVALVSPRVFGEGRSSVHERGQGAMAG